MVKKTVTTAAVIAAMLVSLAQAQDSTKKSTTTFTGSVDAYYRYDFSGKAENNKTSFTNSNNSFELGMASLRVDHNMGKLGATIDLGFGRRAQEFSYPDGNGTGVPGNGFYSLASIKQLYVTLAASDKVKFTAGKFATHIGFELLDAYANRNYSMSYGFSYGPFSHTGIKMDVSLGGKSAFMVGIANPTDLATTTSQVKVIIAQFSTGTKNDKLKAWLNYQGGTDLSQVDLVINGIVSSKFGINYDGTIADKAGHSWSSNALYFNYDPTSTFGLTLRGEYFSDKNSVTGISAKSLNIFVPTLSANFKIDNLTIIPEIRLDAANNSSIFIDGKNAATKSAGNFLIAATYKF